MLFNSFIFAAFLPICFAIYWLLRKNLSLQNVFLVLSGAVFYGWWNWRYLFLLYFSIILDFSIGLLIDKTESENRKKLFLATSLILNFGILCVFKYYNFFVQSFLDAFSLFGVTLNIHTWSIILPVGISFYTFQSASYSLDIYKGRIKPTSNLVTYAAFISFFPQLVAGPIERASNLLGQVSKARIFKYDVAASGMRLILWGLFKKVVIADNLSPYVEKAFSGHEHLGTLSLLLGAIYFAVQIYCDFSGYSDIAIGVAKLFGFELMSNFKFPFFSRSIPEFWARWHISLTQWLNDYIYTQVSLALRRYQKWGIAAGIMLTFLTSGFWHGANWTFVIWGCLNGLLFMPYVIKGKMLPRRDVVAKGKWFPSLKELLQMAGIFMLWSLILVFFRAENVGQAFSYFAGIASRPTGVVTLTTGLGFVALILLLDWLNRNNERDPQILRLPNKGLRMAVEIVMAILIFVNMLGGYQSFVYFQF